MARISTGRRKKYATVHGTKPGQKKDRFPIPPGDKKHARLALQDLPKAKGLSPAQKTKIHAKAERVLHGGKSKPRKKG